MGQCRKHWEMPSGTPENEKLWYALGILAGKIRALINHEAGKEGNPMKRFSRELHRKRKRDSERIL